MIRPWRWIWCFKCRFQYVMRRCFGICTESSETSSYDDCPYQRILYNKFFDLWQWSTALSVTYSGGSLHPVSALGNTVVRAGESRFNVIFVVMRSLGGTDVAPSMDVTFVVPTSSIIMKRLFTYMTVNHLVVRNNSSLYQVADLSSSTSKASRGRST